MVVGPWMIASDIRRHVIPNYAQFSLLLLTELSFLGEKNASFFHANALGMYVLIGGLLTRFLSGARVGMGDVKLVAILAIILGDVEKVISSVTIASFFGLIWALLTHKRAIPFAPALIGGALVILLLNP